LGNRTANHVERSCGTRTLRLSQRALERIADERHAVNYTERVRGFRLFHIILLPEWTISPEHFDRLSSQLGTSIFTDVTLFLRKRL
jgi:hypothetical protein